MNARHAVPGTDRRPARPGIVGHGAGERVESVGRKPLSDGLSADLAGNVYITDVEHGAVLRMAPGGAADDHRPVAAAALG
jgi:hypothetical protein